MEFTTTVLNICRQTGKQYDLTMRQYAVLITLAAQKKAENREVRSIAAALQISKPAVSRSVDKLGDLNLIVRKAPRGDKRIPHVDITEEGTALIAHVRAGAKPAEA